MQKKKQFSNYLPLRFKKNIYFFVFNLFIYYRIVMNNSLLLFIVPVFDTKNSKNTD